MGVRWYDYSAFRTVFGAAGSMVFGLHCVFLRSAWRASCVFALPALVFLRGLRSCPSAEVTPSCSRPALSGLGGLQELVLQ